MTATAKAKASKQVAAKARQVLEFAEAKAKDISDWLELHFALFGVEAL